MIYKKVEFSNPIIKDRLRIIENSKYKLIFRTFLESGGGQNQLHYHSKINETFKIIQGELNIIINNEEKILRTGDEYSILPYTNHMFYNKSDKQVVFDVEIKSPNKMMNALQIMYGLSSDEKTNKEGLPNNIFHTAIGLNLMDAFSPKIPFIVQKTGISFFYNLGKILGIEKQLINKYCH
ncbi:cupin domain-containing protein [Brumimicrobium mesophilum]|uniref:cupin domain-containing protein n=1 Tax=Brumimicrobium mesophilum TaxID=392717 RepID=UPI000D13F936|nr:cupin domain-containing protein [Brumimicrobium mesophilum]